MEITLLGRIPSKKNSRVKYKNGAIGVSKAYTVWHKNAMNQLFIQRIKKSKLENINIKLSIYYPDLIKADNTNKAESVMDLLVDYGLIKDDNWKCVPSIIITGELDRVNPRVEITITEIEK